MFFLEGTDWKFDYLEVSNVVLKMSCDGES